MDPSTVPAPLQGKESQQNRTTTSQDSRIGMWTNSSLPQEEDAVSSYEFTAWITQPSVISWTRQGRGGTLLERHFCSVEHSYHL
jgi:hypothetical protein